MLNFVTERDIAIVDSERLLWTEYCIKLCDTTCTEVDILKNPKALLCTHRGL